MSYLTYIIANQKQKHQPIPRNILEQKHIWPFKSH